SRHWIGCDSQKKAGAQGYQTKQHHGELRAVGVTLWEMLTGKTPFRGTSAEVIYQHQHASLPLEQLKDIPQPVVVLVEALLEKDPARRLQSPTELLKAMPTDYGRY